LAAIVFLEFERLNSNEPISVDILSKNKPSKCCLRYC